MRDFLKTKIIRIDPENIDIEDIRAAAGVLKAGGLVAFPTETVYGLGANAFDETAVRKIFKAKGRPQDNPLIVHIASVEDIEPLVRGLTPVTGTLMERFWPGPLTLVMNKSDRIPPAVSAGLETVAVRMPSHPVALFLIREAGLPVAAPSANVSGRPSPTSAQHVEEDLTGRVDVIIDAGRTDIGLESTVLDLTAYPPVILRPGGITPAQLEEAIGEVSIDPAATEKTPAKLKPRSPGMKYRHYSPKAEMLIVEGEISKVVEKIRELALSYAARGVIVGILATDQTRDMYPAARVISAGDRDKPETIAANLFRTLREFDGSGVGLILAEAVDGNGIGLAVMNRLNKAAGYNVIKV